MGTFYRQLIHGNALLLIIILGIGGSFHCGYHITGLSSPSPYIQHFINSSWFDRYGEPPSPESATMVWSLVVSMFAVGGLFGVFSVKFFTGKLGSKRAMIGNNLISILGAGVMLTSKWAQSFEMIIVARTLFGFSAALGTSLHLMYLGEISPRQIRGSVTLTSATFLSLGKLSGQFFGLTEILGGQDMWNIVLSVPACLSLVQVLALPFLPEPPRYLFIEKRDDKACKKALQHLWGPGEYKQEMDEMLMEQLASEAAPPKSFLQLIRDRTVRWQLITMSTIFCCNQLSGMSAISIFAFDVFVKAGIPKENVRYVTLGLGLSEIVTSLVSGLLIEYSGRRPLLWGGYGFMSLIWVLVTITLNLKDTYYWISYLSAALIFLFFVFFCGGPGAATGTLNNELFTQSNRLAAFALVGFLRWFMFAMQGLIFPFIIKTFGSYCFTLFALTSLLGSLYAFFILPETKGKTLLEISAEFKTISVCGKFWSKEETKETQL
ncbi:solute carrier family 2, facilitated glucose transporter member 9 [Oryzias latipes]|uniref:solute carrier family 2, facilitated glucose transporter member 9 n=1 Tax=Oryzias latipes TaxID=8090 RepID=UPI0009D9AC71|nr:solute carrier family 2, facilitated glucose transporter member 9 [Oryzias latipes]